MSFDKISTLPLELLDEIVSYVRLFAFLGLPLTNPL